MIGTILGDVLLRSIPEHLVAGVSAGQLKVYGSIIRDLGSGQIVGHLQETSGLAQLAGSLITAPASVPLKGAGLVVDAVGHGVAYHQNEQIKAGVAILQSMQVAQLAMGVAAIGVSVAGLIVLAKKLSAVESKVDAIGGTLEKLAGTIEDLRRDRITEDMIRLRTAMEQLDEGWLLPDPVPQWRAVANEAHFLSNRFRQRAVELLELAPAEPLAAEPFLEASALAANTRVSARMASNDSAAALRAAEESAVAIAQAGEKVQLGASVLSSMPSDVLPASSAWGVELERRTDALRPAVERSRARESAAAATCLTLQELERRQIGSRTWLEVARNEDQAPLLCMLAS